MSVKHQFKKRTLATAIAQFGLVPATVLLGAANAAFGQTTANFYVDGTDTNRINQLDGALEIVSPIGAPNTGATGADANATLVNPGNYQVGVGASADASQISFYSGGGAANPWASGILAASFGSEGVNQGKLRNPSLSNGGNGGTVTVDSTGLSDASATQITLSGYGTPALTGELTLTGVYALSQGGQNSLALDSSGINQGSYSNGGNGGQVNVDFLGLINDEGSFNSSAGPLIYNAIGISAISRGGVFQCWDYDCTGNNYDNSTYNTPGAGGDVNVTLHSGSDITLDSGSAIGIYAASMNGAILGTNSGDAFNVNTSTQSAGSVTINVQEGANITVGGGSALEAYGVFGLSAGSELQVPLEYQTGSTELVNLGGAAFGGDVTVDNAGTVSATGVLAIGVGGMNVGGQAAVGLLGVDQAGVYEPNKNRDRYQLTPQVLGDVSVSNSGTINVDGETSFGLLAVSLGRGFVFHNPSDWLTTDLLDPQGDFDGDGIINALDTDDDNDGVSDWDDSDNNNNGIPDYPCTASTTPGDFPTCNGSESGLVLGNTDSGTSTSAGDVYAQNSGSITNGVEGEEGSFAYGMLALSVGGGGATGSGGLGVIAGDSGGAGGDGGAVTVKNSGDITTYGNHSQAVVAASVGGGGGAGGSVSMGFISIGGGGGSGGDGGEVVVDLTGVGTITTDGALSEGVLAQSIGGGGGVGGAGTAAGKELTIAIGSSGGDGGIGGSVYVDASENDDPLADSFTGLPVFANLDLSGFEIITTGKQASGVLAQSIGGGGGVGGSATSYGLDVVFGYNLDIGSAGGTGGNASDTTVNSIFDIYVEGDNSRGITAQSIGAGGGLGGDASTNTVNIEIPLAEVPNLFGNTTIGAKGTSGGNGSTVEITNGGLIVTDGEAAIGILGQSIGGGGGDGGAASTWNKFANLPVPVEGWGIQASAAVGGSGGEGGDASAVTVSNGYNGNLEGVGYVAGTVLTHGTSSAGLVAQSIGGGGGVGGTGDVSSGKSFWYEVATTLLPLFVEGKPFANIDMDVSVGGSGGAGGNGGDVTLINGIQDKDLGGYQGGTVVTLGGNSHGLIAQSIGGGGGLASGGALHNTGGQINFGLALGGSGGVAGNGGNVSVLNPTGSVIRTGDVIVEKSSEEEISAGLSPYIMVTTGGGSVGILAQSIGGGGGAGGNASASSTLPDKKKGDAKVFMAYFKRALEFLPKEKKPGAFWKKLEVNMNLSIAGSGGAAGVGGAVDVTNDGSIETFGDQAFGIHAQSIGGGGGSGGSVEAEPVNWQTLAAAPAEYSRISFGATVGGGGGDGNHGGTVTVDHQANGLIVTHGYGSNGIYAQSIGGGGGQAGVAAVNSEGFLYLGYNQQGDGGPGGAGDAVTVTSAGAIETLGDDANGIFAQSIGGGGGVVTAGCTNSELAPVSFHFASWGQSPCWGNSGSEDGLVADETTSSDTSESEESNRGAMISFAVQMGGTDGTSDHGMDGGTVDIEVSDLIATYGSRSMGVVAQSIGGGGGYVSQDATAFEETSVGEGAGVNHSHGGTVTVNLTDNASIQTYGDGAWGIFAQSIGGSGGYSGDSSLNLGLISSNTVTNVCCGDFSSGADGGTVNISLASGTQIVTAGKNAHGIVAQSVGGGGGIAGGGDNDPNALVYMGNPRSPEWNSQGRPDITMTGQGGAINIDVDQGASISVTGDGAIGILAQSTGNDAYQSPITININGSVSAGGTTTNDAGNTSAANLASAAGSTGFDCEGCMNSSAILISGGTSGLAGGNGHGNAPNLITVGSTGDVSVADLDFAAIYSTYGQTNVSIIGNVSGGIVLGDSSTDPTLSANLGNVTVEAGGNWDAGTTNVVAQNSIHNYGTINVSSAPTKVFGSLKQYETGELQFALDPNVHTEVSALTVSGLARIDGKITPVVQTLLPGELRLLTAGSLEGTPSIDDPLVFNWQLNTANGTDLKLAALADFHSDDISLSQNHGSVADYLERNWNSGDGSLGSHFAYMLALETEDQYSSMLTTLSEPEVLQHDVAALRAMPAFMGDVIDCADASGAQVQGDKANCVWLQAGMSSGRYDGSDTQRTDIDSTLFAIGMQREIQPGWYLGGAFGRNRSDIKANSFRGDGHTDMFALGLRHDAGDWSMGASLAYGNGSFDSMRNFALPGLVGARSASNATMSSASGLDVIALQAQASYRFEWDNVYLRPELSLAVSNVERDAFEEESMVDGHLFLLQAASDSNTLYWVTPHVELGGQWQVGEGTQLKAYVDAGVRVAPWDSEIDLRFAGVSEDTGWFRNSIDDPLSAAMLKAGVELFSDESLALKLEYGLEDNGDYQIQTGSARVDWRF